MAEYIEREAVIKHLRECEGTPPEMCYTYPIFKAIECFVEGVPSADVVEVVRCKDCVNYCGFERCKNGICDLDSVSKRAVYPNDFCSYGERKKQ